MARGGMKPATRATPATREKILLFDGPADAPQMPPEGV
jgi:hypothetical protein